MDEISRDKHGRYHVTSKRYVAAFEYGRKKTGAIGFDGPRTDGESANFVFVEGDRLIVSVEQEHAMDSYNEPFECSVGLSRYQAVALRDWLTDMLKGAPPVLVPSLPVSPHDS